jgi:hypothetical protein
MAIAPPCVPLPKVPNIPKIKLPLGGELSAFADFSVATPSDCTLTFSLLVQLAPLLASISCLIKVLGVIGALKDFASNPLTKGPDLIAAIEKAADCILAASPPYISIVASIKGILELILNFIGCIVDQLDSLAKFRATIDIESAKGNPILEASLKCAQENAETSSAALMQSIEPVKPLIDSVNILMGIAGLPEITLSVDSSPDADATVADWGVHVVSDGLLITGQNPASSGPAAKTLMAAVKQKARSAATA